MVGPIGARRASSRLVLGTEWHPTLFLHHGASMYLEREWAWALGWLLSRILAGGAEGGAAGWRRKKRRDRDTGACMSQILGVGDWGTRRLLVRKHARATGVLCQGAEEGGGGGVEERAGRDE